MRRLVTLQLAGELYGIDVAHVSAIVAPMRISPVPASSPVILGIANLRGAMLPILDLRPWLGLPREGFGPDAEIVVVDWDGIRAGIMADGVRQLVRLPEDRFVEAPAVSSETSRPYLKEASQTELGMLIVFDVAAFLRDTAGHMVTVQSGPDDWRTVA